MQIYTEKPQFARPFRATDPLSLASRAHHNQAWRNWFPPRAKPSVNERLKDVLNKPRERLEIEDTRLEPRWRDDIVLSNSRRTDMVRKPQLPQDVQDRINAVLDRAGEAYRAGELRRSLEIAEEAWDMIPPPPYKWDYFAQSLSAGFVRDYGELADAGEVERWLPHLYAAYDDLDKRDQYTLMTEAEARLDLDQKEAAVALFKRIFEIYGAEGFRGEHRRYLDMIEDVQ